MYVPKNLCRTKAITDLKPDWHDDYKVKYKIKVIMTNHASDSMEWKQHFTTKQERDRLGQSYSDNVRIL
jgi:type I restriction enzyme R subunit